MPRPPRSTLLPDRTLFRSIITGMHVPTRPRMGLHAGTADPAEQDALARAFYDEALAIGDAYARPYPGIAAMADRKSTRLNSSHANISYAVFCLTHKMSVNK